LTSPSWQTKPTDRFILRWIKCHLSARITPQLARVPGLAPWMVTVSAAALGVLAGVVFGLGWGFAAGCMAAVAQVLDGVDGQLARLKGMETAWGAFWDSTLDRYADGAMLVGLCTYIGRKIPQIPLAVLIPLGTVALIGCSLISYTTARAENLRLPLGPPTLLSKGTRTTILIVSAWATLLWKGAAFMALLALAALANVVVIQRLRRAKGACLPREP
jgi:phosphatidylglycerophosphate synthase